MSLQLFVTNCFINPGRKGKAWKGVMSLFLRIMGNRIL